MKAITIKCNDRSYVKEITIRDLPKKTEEISALASILYNTESTDGFEELINDIRGSESFYASLVRAMISTRKLSTELYELIYDVFKGFITIESALVLTVYTDNPVPKHIYNEICHRRNWKAS